MQADQAQLRDFAARYTAAWCSQDPMRVAGFYSLGGALTVNNSDAGQLIRINEIVLQCNATLHYNVVHEDGSIQLAFI